MIDLHLHTTASDGCDTPDQLLAQVARAGVRLLSVTDHDTVAALPAVAAGAARLGLGWLAGIEVTAVDRGRDVHVLGYGFDPEDAALVEFLGRQQRSRLQRVIGLRDRCAALGMPFGAAPLIAAAEAGVGRAVGRAHVARALLAAGHVGSIEEAFDRWLAPGRPAFVPRTGAAVDEVVARIQAAGGLASLAHPHLLHDDDEVRRLLGCGLDALEVYHSDHDVEAVARYQRLSRETGLAQTGGSDFHGEASNRRRAIGSTPLPADAYAELRARACRSARGRDWPVLEDAP